MTITLPINVSYIIGKLNESGYEAYAVGGCVRDSMLGRVPQDWDITISALPEEIKAIFPRTVDTGIEHGTVTVMIGREGYETTTYRIDGKYTDSRHPDNVSFTRSLEEDLKRRDFTINAMAYCDEGLVDLFEGTKDLDRKIIRCVGEPAQRFGEDALRILRAVRFSAQLGFTIDEATSDAAMQLAPTLSNISAERIHVELNKLLLSAHPDRINDLQRLKISDVILPELNIKSGRTAELISLLEQAPASRYIRWALMLLYTGSAAEIMKRLKFDNLTMHTVCELIRLSGSTPETLDAVGMRRLMHDADADNMELLFDFLKALHPNINYDSAYALYRNILERKDCTNLKDLKINGKDLIASGIPSGPGIGAALDSLLEQVLVNPALNEHETLLELCRKNNSEIF